MTPGQRSAQAALRARLQERARTLLAADQAVVAQLAAARSQIVAQLAAQPADWKQWHLARLVDQLDAVLTGAAGRAGTAADNGLRSAWQQGEDFIDKPLAVAGYSVELRLGLLDVRVLQALRIFTVDRLRAVSADAMGKIRQQLGLVTIGGITPFEAIKSIQAQLEGATPHRATTIVRTEVSRAFAVASEQRLVQAADLVPGLQKQWRRSGKIHSRWSHDLMDGQVVDADKPFRVPNPGGGIDLMRCPHDPKVPAEQVINCGCTMLPFIKGWQMAKPSTQFNLDGEKPLFSTSKT